MSVPTPARLGVSGALVRLTLPNGVAFPAAGPSEMAELAATLRAGPVQVTTVAVNAERGAFEVSHVEQGVTRLDAAEFAAAVTASVTRLRPAVQTALTWPRTSRECAGLEAELTRFADALERPVWAPEPAGGAIVLPGVGEFAAVDEIGSPAAWRAYGSRAGTPTRLRSDLDGRLTPMGELAVDAFPGAPLVCVPPAQLEQLRDWYASAVACPGLFAFDLAVLDDGRLGGCLRDGAAMAVGPRELRQLLTRAGWTGEDLLLLAQPAAQLWDAMAHHVRHLLDSLAVDLWLAAPDAEVWVRPDGSLDAEGPDGAELAWRVLAYGRSDAETAHIPVPAALAQGRQVSPAVRPDDRRAAPLTSASPGPAIAMPLAPIMGMPASPLAPPGPPPSRSPPTPPSGQTPRRALAAPTGRPERAHAVAWLPPAPAVNPRSIELYLAPAEPDEPGRWCVPTADLFLLAGQDPLRLAEAGGAATLLRVHLPAQSAVELHEYAQQAPAPVRRREECTHLLPLAWLAAARVTASYRLDGHGGIVDRQPAADPALAARFSGAEHGIDGLPNDVVHWPDRRLRTDAPSYLTLHEDLSGANERTLLERGYLPLSRRRPEMGRGERLLEVRIRRRSAIDVPATVERLAGLPVVGRLREFAELDLLLAERDFATATVTRVWRSGSRRRPVVDRVDGATLAEVLVAIGEPVRKR